jgi:DNA-binding transcriptional LysR family regulator
MGKLPEDALLDLRNVRAFSTVAREGSFTKAAAVLHYAQSSITAQIQSLESQLGVVLLDRLSTGVELTAAGEGFLLYAERLLSLACEACDSVQSGNEPAGTLTLSACESVLTYRLPEVLKTFQNRYPKVRVELNAPGMGEAGPPLGHGVDIAVSISEPIKDPQLIAEPLLREAICAFVAKEHPLAGRKSIKPHDLAQEQWLLTEESCSYRTMFENALAAAGIRPSRSLEFASVEAIKHCAKARMGIAVLPTMVVQEELQHETLALVPWPNPSLNVYIQLVRRKEKWFSPAMQAFWATAVDVLGKSNPISGRTKQRNVVTGERPAEWPGLSRSRAR